MAEVDNQEQNLSTESECPVSGRRHTRPDECGLVAESAESEDPAPEFPPNRSYGPGVQLC